MKEAVGETWGVEPDCEEDVDEEDADAEEADV
jgi:hypothetical protein